MGGIGRRHTTGWCPGGRRGTEEQCQHMVKGCGNISAKKKVSKKNEATAVNANQCNMKKKNVEGTRRRKEQAAGGNAERRPSWSKEGECLR